MSLYGEDLNAALFARGRFKDEAAEALAGAIELRATDDEMRADQWDRARELIPEVIHSDTDIARLLAASVGSTPGAAPQNKRARTVRAAGPTATGKVLPMTTTILQPPHGPRPLFSTPEKPPRRHEPADATHTPDPTADGSQTPLRVTVPRKINGYWTANASIHGTTRTFHRRFGSWQTDRKRTDQWPQNAVRKEAAPHVARALQAKIRRLERREARETQ